MILVAYDFNQWCVYLIFSIAFFAFLLSLIHMRSSLKHNWKKPYKIISCHDKVTCRAEQLYSEGCPISFHSSKENFNSTQFIDPGFFFPSQFNWIHTYLQVSLDTIRANSAILRRWGWGWGWGCTYSAHVPVCTITKELFIEK
jgi:hypothetical protein